MEECQCVIFVSVDHRLQLQLLRRLRSLRGEKERALRKQIVLRRIVLDIERLRDAQLRPKFCIGGRNSSQNRFGNPLLVQRLVSTPADARPLDQLHGRQWVI